MATSANRSSWRREDRIGRAEVLHGLDVGGSRLVRVCEVTKPALVLGSTQPLSQVDEKSAERSGIDIVKRRSGGGAVLVEPGQLIWVDVTLPAGDPLWEEDVSRAFWWLGDAWAAALRLLGFDGATVHRGGLIASRWSSLVCFSGLGPGEITLEGRKLVGAAQRRTRAGALFQCAVPLRWEPERLLSVLELTPEDRETALAEMDGSVGYLGHVAPDDVIAAFLSRLP